MHIIYMNIGVDFLGSLYENIRNTQTAIVIMNAYNSTRVLGYYIYIPCILCNSTRVLGYYIYIPCILCNSTLVLGYYIYIPCILCNSTRVLGYYIYIPCILCNSNIVLIRQHSNYSITTISCSLSLGNYYTDDVTHPRPKHFTRDSKIITNQI